MIADPPPILKIGAVVLRGMTAVDCAERREGDAVPFSEYQILIVQPIPKKLGEVPPFVLPRGSRQYQAADGQWHDARDEATGLAHAATLEPYARGLQREIEEEAGITPTQLAAAQVIEMGDMLFQSRSKGIYPIHWFVVVVDGTLAQTLVQQVPVDALAVRWASLDAIKTMATCGAFSPGYIPVIEAAITCAHGAA